MTEADTSEMTVLELKEAIERKDDLLLLDCREPFEARIASIPGSVLIPMGDIKRRIGEVDRDRDVVVYCQAGARSAMVVRFLRQEGYRARNLIGGMNAWTRMR